mgnify:CR=1 FL=1
MKGDKKMIEFQDLILKNPDKIKLKDENGIIHTFEIIEPTEDEIEQDSDTPITAEVLNIMQTVQSEKITLNEIISANTNYTIPIYYRVGDNSLEVIYCSSKLVKRTRLQRNRQRRRSI